MQLYLFLKSLTIVSACHECPIGCFANPSGVLDIVNEVELVAYLEDGKPVVDSLNLVDPNEVVVVTVLTSV